MRLATGHLLLVLLLALPALAQEAAKFAPANAAVFIEVHDLAQLRKDWAGDPLAKFLRENVPMIEQPGWEAVEKVLDMKREEVVDRFFGTTAAIVVIDTNEQEPAMVISKVSEADAGLAVEKLGLKTAGEFGGFRGYKSADDKAHIAIGKGWVIVAQPRHSDAARAVLEGKVKSLAENVVFAQWTGKLPPGRVATAFVRAADDNVHALGAYRKGRDLTLQYRGKAPEMAALFAKLGDGRALDFGPLPADTIAAVTANLIPDAGPNAAQLDRLFPGKTFEKDILPRLGSPAVVFLGEVQGGKLEPNPGLSLPVVGISLKLKDKAVADDLTKAIDGLMFLANFAAANWKGPGVEVKEISHGKVSFRSANVGAALAHRSQRDEVRAVTLSYGPVGDWYIVCTQDQFFRQCIDASLDSTTSLIASRAFTSMPLKNHEGTIVTAVLRPAALSAHVNTWLAHWKQVRPQVIEASTAADPGTPEAQLVRGARIVAGLLDHYQSMSLQAYRDGDGIAAQADVLRK
jgi:hypothetical protein